ncbi:MAG: hypothetical protein V8S24_12215 [Gordonibacter pamelaeae]
MFVMLLKSSRLVTDLLDESRPPLPYHQIYLAGHTPPALGSEFGGLGWCGSKMMGEQKG